MANTLIYIQNDTPMETSCQELNQRRQDRCGDGAAAGTEAASPAAPGKIATWGNHRGTPADPVNVWCPARELVFSYNFWFIESFERYAAATAAPST
jgi:hypothetical protein